MIGCKHSAAGYTTTTQVREESLSNHFARYPFVGIVNPELIYSAKL